MSNVISGALPEDKPLKGDLAMVFGKDGENGKSAYEIAVEKGFKGTEEEWLESLKAAVKLGSLTPDYFDRSYLEWRGRTTVNTFADLDEIIESDTSLNTAFTVMFTGLSPIKSLVGDGTFFALKSNTSESLLLTNVDNGEVWSYVKGSNEPTKVSSDNEDSESPEYWEYAKSHVAETPSGLLDMLTEKQIMRVKALNGSDLYYQLGDNEAIAIKTADSYLLFDLTNGKRYKFDPMGGLEEIKRITDGDIDSEYLFSEAMREKYLGLPMVKATPASLTDDWFNAQTTPGIYQVRSSGNEPCVLIVLKPNTDFHLVQIKLGNNKFEYRCGEAEIPNVFFADSWTAWFDLLSTSEGNSGQDGFSPTAKVTQTADGATITITDKDGTTSATVVNGKDGEDGTDGYTPIKGVDYFDGKDGTSVTVTNVTESTADGGSNVVAFSDGKTITIKNGSKGSTGATGSAGKDGKDGVDGKDGYTPIKGVDYFDGVNGKDGKDGVDGKDGFGIYIGSGKMPDNYNVQLDPEGVPVSISDIVEQVALTSASREELNRVYFDSIGSPVPQLPADGRVKGESIGSGEDVANFTNLVASDFSNCTLNSRWSVSGGKVSAANGYVLLNMIPVAVGDKLYINLSADAFNKDYSKVMFYAGNGTLLNDGYKATDDPYINLDTSGDIAVITVANVNGGVPVNVRISLYISASAITNADIANLVITKNEEITYRSTSEVVEVSADFDADNCTANDIYEYIDKIVEKFPNYITKEIMGKDASGIYDCNRYVLSKRHYMAWQKEKYPKMYAWVNGSTTIYSASVSPRIGDTLYSTSYIGTAYGTVTAVNNANRTRTVGGKVFTQDRTKDVEPTLVYTTILTETVGGVTVKSNAVGANIVDASGTKLARIASVDGNTITSNHATPITYIRYPLGDLNSKRESFEKVVVWANEHGGMVGDTREPAIIMARFIKDLCENVNNTFLKYLKNNLMLVIIPVANPYGFNNNEINNRGYFNANNVNINRNYDTAGWINSPTDAGGLGEYGGSEVETQYLMNTLQDSKAIVGMSLHTLGYLTENGESNVSDGLCAYQGNGFDADKIAKVAEVMKANYNLDFIDYGTADPAVCGKSPAYITHAGAKGGIVEMQPREALNPEGTEHSAFVMEACYTEFLHCLYMWLTDATDTN